MSPTQTTGVDFTVSPRVQRHVDEKLGVLDRYLGDVVRTDATIHPMPDHVYRVDVRFHRSRGQLVAVHAQGHSVYAAINLAADKARTRLGRLHHKEVDRAHRAA